MPTAKHRKKRKKTVKEHKLNVSIKQNKCRKLNEIYQDRIKTTYDTRTLHPMFPIWLKTSALKIQFAPAGNSISQETIEKMAIKFSVIQKRPSGSLPNAQTLSGPGTIGKSISVRRSDSVWKR